MISLLFLGIMLDLWCWKSRSVAQCLFIYEFLHILVVNSIEVDYGFYQSFALFCEISIIAVAVGCNSCANVVSATLVFFFISFVEIPVLRDDSHYNQTHIKIFFNMVTLLFTMAAWMAINYLMINFSKDSVVKIANQTNILTEAASEAVILATPTTIEYANQAALRMVLHSQKMFENQLREGDPE